MFEADVNYLAVLIGAIAAQPLGALWYAVIFPNQWMAARGYTEADVEDGNKPMPYLVAFLLALVIAYTLARLVDMVGADSVGDCIAVAAFVWAGLVGAVQATQALFSNAPSKLRVFAIEGGYQLATFVLIGFVLGLFQ